MSYGVLNRNKIILLLSLKLNNNSFTQELNDPVSTFNSYLLYNTELYFSTREQTNCKIIIIKIYLQTKTNVKLFFLKCPAKVIITRAHLYSLFNLHTYMSNLNLIKVYTWHLGYTYVLLSSYMSNKMGHLYVVWLSSSLSKLWMYSSRKVGSKEEVVVKVVKPHYYAITNSSSTENVFFLSQAKLLSKEL